MEAQQYLRCIAALYMSPPTIWKRLRSLHV